MFSVRVETTTIEVAENLVNEACKNVDFQIMNVVKVK
jgi:hypothetical protein